LWNAPHRPSCAAAHEAQVATLDYGAFPLFSCSCYYFARPKPAGFFIPKAFMSIAEIKTYIETHLEAASDDLRTKFAEVVSFVEGKEVEAVGIQQEIADLTAKGYIVTGPFKTEPLSVIEVQP